MVCVLIRKNDIAPILTQLKLVYTANSTQAAKSALYNLLETWLSKYTKITNTLSDTTNLFTFYSLLTPLGPQYIPII